MPVIVEQKLKRVPIRWAERTDWPKAMVEMA